MITTKQAILIYEKDNLISQLEVLTGVPYNDIKQDQGEAILQEIVKLDMFINSEIENDTKPFITIGKKAYKCPDVEKETWGQKIVAEQLIANKFKDNNTKLDLIDSSLELCSIYFMKYLNGKFDADKIEEYKEKLMDCDVYEILRCSFFLFGQLWCSLIERYTTLTLDEIAEWQRLVGTDLKN